MPMVFGSLATINLESRRRSRHIHAALDSGVVITVPQEQMLTFEKASNMGASTSTVTTKPGSSVGSEEAFIRVTHTVSQSSSV